MPCAHCLPWRICLLITFLFISSLLFPRLENYQHFSPSFNFSFSTQLTAHISISPFLRQQFLIISFHAHSFYNNNLPKYLMPVLFCFSNLNFIFPFSPLFSTTSLTNLSLLWLDLWPVAVAVSRPNLTNIYTDTSYTAELLLMLKYYKFCGKVFPKLAHSLVQFRNQRRKVTIKPSNPTKKVHPSNATTLLVDFDSHSIFIIRLFTQFSSSITTTTNATIESVTHLAPLLYNMHKCTHTEMLRFVKILILTDLWAKKPSYILLDHLLKRELCMHKKEIEKNLLLLDLLRRGNWGILHFIVFHTTHSVSRKVSFV